MPHDSPRHGRHSNNMPLLHMAAHRISILLESSGNANTGVMPVDESQLAISQQLLIHTDHVRVYLRWIVIYRDAFRSLFVQYWVAASAWRGFRADGAQRRGPVGT